MTDAPTLQEKITLRVQYPQQYMLTLVSVCLTDTAKVVATCGPPLTKPVIIIHQGHCLSPHLSLAVQGVCDGDTIVLHTVNIQPQKKQAPSDGEKRKAKIKMDNIFNEMLRLADVAFIPYETGLYGSLVFQQMLKEIPEETEPEEILPSFLYQPASEASTDPLPIFWNEPETFNEELNGKNVMPKLKSMPKHNPLDEMPTC